MSDISSHVHIRLSPGRQKKERKILDPVNVAINSLVSQLYSSSQSIYYINAVTSCVLLAFSRLHCLHAGSVHRLRVCCYWTTVPVLC